MASRNRSSTDKSDSHSLPTTNVEDFPVVELDDQEIEITKAIAYLRTYTYEDINGGVVHGDQSPFEAHFVGAMGEIAVAKYLPSTSITQIDTLHENGDGGFDLQADGTTIDVKTTQTNLRVPDLIVPETPHPSAERFILAHRFAGQKIRLMGSADRDVVLDHPVREAPSDRRNYWVPAENLSHFAAEES